MKTLDKDFEKRVNLAVTGRAISGVSTGVALRGNLDNIKMKVRDIRTCLCGKAQVTEILNNGTLLKLDFANYDKDNNEVLNKQAEEKHQAELEAKKAEELAKAKKAEEEALAKKKAEEEKAKKAEAQKAKFENTEDGGIVVDTEKKK